MSIEHDSDEEMTSPAVKKRKRDYDNDNKNKRPEDFIPTINFPKGECLVDPLYLLLALKHSHVFWPVQWKKTIQGFHWIRDHPQFDPVGWQYIKSLYVVRG